MFLKNKIVYNLFLLGIVLMFFSCQWKQKRDEIRISIPVFTKEEKKSYRKTLNRLQVKIDSIVLYNNKIKTKRNGIHPSKVILDSLTKKEFFLGILDTSIVQIDIHVRGGNSRVLMLHDVDMVYNAHPIIKDTISNEFHYMDRIGLFKLNKGFELFAEYDNIIRVRKEYFDKNNVLIDISIYYKYNLLERPLN
jgi:hypothetical protein